MSSGAWPTNPLRVQPLKFATRENLGRSIVPRSFRAADAEIPVRDIIFALPFPHLLSRAQILYCVLTHSGPCIFPIFPFNSLACRIRVLV